MATLGVSLFAVVCLVLRYVQATDIHQNARICVMGGGGAMTNTECLSSRTGMWTVDPNLALPQGITNAVIEQLGDNLACILGGNDGSVVTNHVWCSNGTTGWHASPPLYNVRNDAALLYVRGSTGQGTRLVAAGSISVTDVTSQYVSASYAVRTGATFDELNGASEVGYSLTYARGVSRAVYINGTPCLVGGYNGSHMAATDCYTGDPELPWRLGPPLTAAKSNVYKATIGGRTCVMSDLDLFPGITNLQAECLSQPGVDLEFTLMAFPDRPPEAQHIYGFNFTNFDGLECMGSGSNRSVYGNGVPSTSVTCFNSSWDIYSPGGSLYLTQSSMNVGRLSAVAAYLFDPSIMTSAPTSSPTTTPTFSPTFSPTTTPTFSPTTSLIFSPTTTSPTTSLIFSPTTTSPTTTPTFSPTTSPITSTPTWAPSLRPTTSAPTLAPTVDFVPGGNSTVQTVSQSDYSSAVQLAINNNQPSSGYVSVVLTLDGANGTNGLSGLQGTQIVLNAIYAKLQANGLNISLPQLNPKTVVVDKSTGRTTIILVVSQDVGSAINNLPLSGQNALIPGYSVGVSVKLPSFVGFLLTKLTPIDIGIIIIVLLALIALLVLLHLCARDKRNILASIAIISASFSLAVHCWFLQALYNGWRDSVIVFPYLVAFSTFLPLPHVANVLILLFAFRRVRTRDPDFNAWLETHRFGSIFCYLVGVLGVGHINIASSRICGKCLGAPITHKTRLTLSALGMVGTALEVPRLILQIVVAIVFDSASTAVVPICLGALSLFVGVLQRCYALGYVSNKETEMKEMFHGLGTQ